MLLFSSQVIMVSNTREVARQTAVVVKTLVHNTPIRVSVAIPRAKKNGILSRLSFV